MAGGVCAPAYGFPGEMTQMFLHHLPVRKTADKDEIVPATENPAQFFLSHNVNRTV
jgi:hypothetical protein